MCPLWSETATGYTVLVLKKKNKVFFSSPDYLIYTRTRRPALYVYNIIYITHASSSPLPTSTILYLSYRYLPRTPVCRQIYFVRVYFFCILYTVLVGLAMFSYILYTYVCTAVAANRAGGKFYRPTGRRLPVFGAEAAAAVICARVRRCNNNSLSSLGRHCHRRRLPPSDTRPATIVPQYNA